MILEAVGAVIGFASSAFSLFKSKSNLDKYKDEVKNYNEKVNKFNKGIYVLSNLNGDRVTDFDLSNKLAYSYVGDVCFYYNESFGFLDPNVLLDFHVSDSGASIPSPLAGFDLNHLPVGVAFINGGYTSFLAPLKPFCRWANDQLARKEFNSDSENVYTENRPQHYSFVGLDRLAADFDLNVRQAIRRLAVKSDWEFVSQNKFQLVFTPSNQIMSPMTFYDNEGNFYIIRSSGVAELLLGWDQKPPVIGQIDSRDVRSTFSGLSIRNWEDARLVLEAEAQANEIAQSEQHAVESAKLDLQSKVNETSKNQRRTTLSRIGIMLLVLCGGYWIYKKVKK